MKSRSAFTLLSLVFASTILAQTPAEPAPAAESRAEVATTASNQFRVFTNTDGTGTASFVPRWIDFDTLGDSVIQQVGSFVGVGPIASGLVVRSLTVDTGSVSSGLRLFRTGAATAPYVDFLLMTDATPYASIQVGDSIAWRTLSLNPSGGNVGIGTASPNKKLHIHDSADNQAVQLTGTSTGTTATDGFMFSAVGTLDAQLWSFENGFMRFGTNGIERMRITGDGKIGIGTASPQANLHVMGFMRLDAIADANDYPSMLEMWASGPGGTRNRWTTFVGSASGSLGIMPNAYEIYEYPPGAVPLFAAMRLRIAKAANASPKPFVIDGAGNVGIGVLGPTAALDVVGDILARGNISATGTIFAKYQDVAEWVPATSDMVPGTVVILNPEVSNEVMPSSDRYDVRVAGVVSGQPGLLLGEAGESKEQIATTGRVRVKVDATTAPIRIGDLLVTSDKPGMAMRSDAIEIQGRKFHQPGTIIGKALEPLASGEGEILVLLSLQ